MTDKWKRTLWCKNLYGIQYKVCLQGVDIMSMRDTSGPGMAEWPCTSGNQTQVKCDLAEFPTEAEARAAETAKSFFEKVANNICPLCRQPIEVEQEVDRWFYARPCGHRLYPGRARAISKWTDHGETLDLDLYAKKGQENE